MMMRPEINYKGIGYFLCKKFTDFEKINFSPQKSAPGDFSLMSYRVLIKYFPHLTSAVLRGT